MRIHRVPGASLPSSKFVALEATLKEENEVGPRMDRGRFAPTYNGSVRRERSLWGRGAVIDTDMDYTGWERIFRLLN